MRWKRTRRANKDGGDDEEGDEEEGGMRQGRDFFKGEGEREAGMDGRDPREPEPGEAAKCCCEVRLRLGGCAEDCTI